MIDFLAVFSRGAANRSIHGSGHSQVIEVDGDPFRTTRYDRPIEGAGDGTPALATLLLVERRPASRRELRALVQGSTRGELHAGTVVWIHLGDLRAGAGDLTRDDPQWPTRQRIAGVEASEVLGTAVGAVWIESRVVNEATDFDFETAFEQLCGGRPIPRDALDVLKDSPATGSSGPDGVARLRTIVSHARHEMFRAVGPIDWNIAIGGAHAMERASRECASALDSVRRIGAGLPAGRDLFDSGSSLGARWDAVRESLASACVRVEESLHAGRFGDGSGFRSAYGTFRTALQDATKFLDALQDESVTRDHEVTR